ncbi:MAG: amidohydrolase family protein [Oscillospiraceae bacterium]|nr:amidohydrolase family protein [Oscillospiraceae bacterium]
MKIFDGHVHVTDIPVDNAQFLQRLQAVGLSGALLISKKPASLYHYPSTATTKERLDSLFAVTEEAKGLFPFYFIDPMEHDALTQVEYAVQRGVAGFKVVCNRFYPGDDKAMRVFERIALHNKPLLFHTGILYDGRNSSTRYNRPGEFDALFSIEGLRFCLAHVSWPWCEECIALFGKFENSKGKYPNSKTQMYIDIAPGTPPARRRDALTQLFGFDYSPEDYVIFGTDGCAGDYSGEYTQSILTRDKAILEEMGIFERVAPKLYHDNLLRFMGVANDSNTL